jgi:acyl-CoA synthetase (AMP-forming)/AMP-acid ligase II
LRRASRAEIQSILHPNQSQPGILRQSCQILNLEVPFRLHEFWTMNLARALAKSVHQHPDKSALFWGGSQFSYREIWSQSLAVAHQLRGQFGVRAGDRVGLWLKNRPEFVPALFGILQTGAAVVPINNFLKPAEVGFILADAGIDLIILDETMREGFDQLRAERPGLRALAVENFASRAASETEEECRRGESDLFTLPAQRVIPKGRCFRTAIYWPTWLVANANWKQSEKTGSWCSCQCSTASC